jgi:hypothetical protein
MSRRDGSEALRVSLAAYLEGEVTPSEAAAIEKQLAASPVAQRQLAELRSIRDVLAEPGAEARAVDLVPSLTRALDAPPPRRRRPLLLWAGGFAAAAGIATMVVAFGLTGRDPEFRAKSGGAPAHAPERWAGIQIFRLGAANRPERVADRISRSDGLLFSYTNLGPRPFSYLMIFGVDARGEVSWFHPAYERASEDPGSMPARRGEADVALAEVIHHDLPPGPLAVHALFTARPLQVREIESLLARRGGAARDSLTVPDSVDQVFIVEVTP